VFGLHCPETSSIATKCSRIIAIKFGNLYFLDDFCILARFADRLYTKPDSVNGAASARASANISSNITRTGTSKC
jgi:hypothetical protein